MSSNKGASAQKSTKLINFPFMTSENEKKAPFIKEGFGPAGETLYAWHCHSERSEESHSLKH
jgi:hypothetical protein